jgi:hypothetical protein
LGGLCRPLSRVVQASGAIKTGQVSSCEGAEACATDWRALRMRPSAQIVP